MTTMAPRTNRDTGSESRAHSELGSFSALWLTLLLGIFLLGLLILLSSRKTDIPSISPTTAALPVTDPTFRFVVVGDHGSGDESESVIASEIKSWVEGNPTDAFVTTGDNVYPDAEERYFDQAWIEPYGWVDSAGLEVVPAVGNHDYVFSGGAELLRFFGTESWYKVELPDVDIFVLDSNQVGDDSQTRWLEDSLAASTAAWQVVVFHHPAFSCSEHGSTSSVIEEWVPLFESNGVDLVLNGHDHNYQRFAERGGITYVVTGGGGARLYGLEECINGEPSRIAMNDEQHHFLAITGSPSLLRLQAIAPDASLLDDFTLMS